MAQSFHSLTLSRSHVRAAVWPSSIAGIAKERRKRTLRGRGQWCGVGRSTPVASRAAGRKTRRLRDWGFLPGSEGGSFTQRNTDISHSFFPRTGQRIFIRDQPHRSCSFVSGRVTCQVAHGIDHGTIDRIVLSARPGRNRGLSDLTRWQRRLVKIQSFHIFSAISALQV